MKKIFIVFYLLLLGCVGAIEANSDIPFGFIEAGQDFSFYYSYNEEIDDFQFMPLSKEAYKHISKDEKKYYKKMKRFYKHLLKNNFQKAMQEDSDFLPAYYTAYKYAKDKSDYKNALHYWQNIIRIDEKAQIFTESYKDRELAFVYFFNKNYYFFIKTIKPYLNKKEYQNDLTYYMLAYSFYEINDYKNSILYAKKIEASKEYKMDAFDLLYLAYQKLNNKQQARQYALKIVAYKPNEVSYIRMLKVANSDSEKLKYAKLLSDLYYQKQDYKNCALVSLFDITPIEDKKIVNAGKTISGFSNFPSFKKIYEKDYSYMTDLDVIERQKNFHASTNECIKKYTGSNLKACFASINDEQKEISYRYIEKKQELMKRIAEQQRIKQMQIMNYNLMQQNYNLQNINYQLSRPRYTNTTITPIGNTYYMNSYSY